MPTVFELPAGRASALMYALRKGAPTHALTVRLDGRHVEGKRLSVPLTSTEARELDAVIVDLLQRRDFRRFMKAPQRRGTLGESVREALKAIYEEPGVS